MSSGFEYGFYTTVDMVRKTWKIRSSQEHWTNHLFNTTVEETWKTLFSAEEMDDSTWRQIIDNLSWIKSIQGTTAMGLGPYLGTRVVDGLIDEATRQKLVTETTKLRGHLDPNPKKKGTVLNLVHPTLYLAVAGKTKVRKERYLASSTEEDADIRGYEKLLHFPSAVERIWRSSAKYQWLPSDVLINDDGSEAKFLSYVNGLHPRENGELYSVLESVLAKFIPMFENVLGDVESKAELQKWDSERYKISCGMMERDDCASYARGAGGRLKRTKIDIVRDHAVPTNSKMPRPPPFQPARVTLHGKRLQVIVKLSNIILTPENPSYAFSQWHVDGTNKENIVAIGLYYYSSSNITSSYLSFKNGLRNTELIQTTEGRCLAFSNKLEHFVKSFKLINPSLPGHRKILAFFLVNPKVDILSTAKVPCQSAEWLAEEVKRNPELDNNKNWSMTLREAKLWWDAMEKYRHPPPKSNIRRPHD